MRVNLNDTIPIITIAYVNWWPDSGKNRYLTRFIQQNIGHVIHVHPTKNPDILISSVFADINNVRNIKAKCKLLFYGENLNRFPPYNDDKILYDTFDLIVGFKNTDLSKKQIRFPLWLTYYPYYKYNEDDNILTCIQNQYNENITKQKDIFASIISRHDDGGHRSIIFNEISKYGDIKSPGIFRNNTPPIGSTHKEKINYISRGTYHICPENSSYEGYFTEKIFQAFEGGTIPLYWAIDFPEPEIINKNKYCFCDVHNKETLEKSIHNVSTNPNQYIEGELFTTNAGEQLQRFYSELLDNILLKI